MGALWKGMAQRNIAGQFLNIFDFDPAHGHTLNHANHQVRAPWDDIIEIPYYIDNMLACCPVTLVSTTCHIKTDSQKRVRAP